MRSLPLSSSLSAIALAALSLTAGAQTVTEIVNGTGAGPGSPLDTARGVAVDESGNVFVAGRISDNVLKITPAGAVTEIIDASGDGRGNPLDDPIGVATDRLGNVYVTGFASDNVFRITPTGEKAEMIDASGAGPGEALAGPIGLSVDLQGNLFVAANSGAFKVTPSRSATKILSVVSYDVALDDAGVAYVSGGASNSAFRVTPGGNITEIIDATGDGNGNTLSFAAGIAVDDANNVFVSGWFSDNAFRITPSRTITEILDDTGDGSGNSLVAPVDIAVDEYGNAFICGAFTQNVFKVAPNGQTTEVVDLNGAGGPSPLSLPYHVALDTIGNAYVSGVSSNNVLRVSFAATSENRNSGSNLPSYNATPPRIGLNWVGNVSGNLSAHTHAQIVGYTSPNNLTLGRGQVLLVGGSQAFQLPLKTTPASWTVSVPPDPSLVGRMLYTQAVHLFGVKRFALSNARDLMIGY